MSAITDSTYKNIQEPLVLPPLFKTVAWRDHTPNASRRIICALAITAGSLVSLIDAVASLALAALTAPAELGGVKLGRSFLIRAGKASILSLFALTFLMYLNIATDNINKKF